MDRRFTYPGALPVVQDDLDPQQMALISMANLSSDLLFDLAQSNVSSLSSTGPTVPATNSVQALVAGFQVSYPAGLNITVATGRMYTPSQVDATAFGLLGTNTATVIQQGQYAGGTLGPFTAVGTSGHSRIDLVTCAFSQVDDDLVAVSYYNSANPSQPLSGIGGSGTQQALHRRQAVTLSIVYGTEAASPVAPAVPAGQIALYQVTQTYGQATYASGNVVVAPGAPFIGGLTAQHHLGITGTAPKIDLTKEVSGVLPIANGGSGASGDTPTAGGLAYGTGSAFAFTAAGTQGEIPFSNGSSAPGWSSATLDASGNFSAHNLTLSGVVSGATFSGNLTLNTNGANTYSYWQYFNYTDTVNGANTTFGWLAGDVASLLGQNTLGLWWNGTAPIASFDKSGNLSIKGNLTGSAAIFSGNVTPNANDTYNLGGSGAEWLNVYGKNGIFNTAGTFSMGALTATTGVFSGNLLVSGVQTSLGYATNQGWTLAVAGAARFDSQIVFNTSVAYPGNLTASGEIYYNSVNGLSIYGAGSSYDFLLTNKNGNNVLLVPTGTQNATFGGTIGVNTTAGSVTALTGLGQTLSAPVDQTVHFQDWSGSLTKNDALTRTLYGARIKPTFNTGASNTTTSYYALFIDTVNTATTGLSTYLISANYGGVNKFLVDSSGNVTGAATGIFNAISATGSASSFGSQAVSMGALTATTGVFSSTVSVGGTITSTATAAGNIVNAASIGTNYAAFHIGNTGNDVYLGSEGSVGGSYITGDSAYDGIIRSGTGLAFSTGGTNLRFRIDSLGTATFAGNVTPNANDTYNLGASGAEWLNVYGKNGIFNTAGTFSMGALTATTGNFSGAVQVAALDAFTASSQVIFGTASGQGSLYGAAGTVDIGSGVHWNGTAWYYDQTSYDLLSLRTGLWYYHASGLTVGGTAAGLTSVFIVDVSGNITKAGSAIFTGNVTPNANDTYNLGASGAEWVNVYGKNGLFSANLSVNTTNTNSTVDIVSGANNNGGLMVESPATSTYIQMYLKDNHAVANSKLSYIQGLNGGFEFGKSNDIQGTFTPFLDINGSTGAASFNGYAVSMGALTATTGTFSGDVLSGSVDCIKATATTTEAAGSWIGTGLNVLFGDGSDGAVTISTNTTLTRDMYYSSLTINVGITLTTAGYRIFCSGTITNNGTIDNSGNTGSYNSGAGAVSGYLLGGGNGGAGGAPGTAGNAGQNASGYEIAASTCGGGAGGNSTGSQAGGSGGTTTVVAASTYGNWRTAFDAIRGYLVNPSNGAFIRLGGGGGGGGGGGASSIYTGSNGGGGGGAMAIAALNIQNNGTISANGGSGAAGGSGSDGVGAGGGGGGGNVVCVYRQYSGSNPVANGGAAGTLNGGGTPPSAGQNGTVLMFQV